MEPTLYQQAMIQALMGQQGMAPGTTGQNASTPYGAAFMTGNMAMPAWMSGTQPQQSTLGATAIPTAGLAQNYAAYPSAAAAQAAAASPNSMVA